MPQNTSMHCFYDVEEIRLTPVSEVHGVKARQLALRTASGTYVDILLYASRDWTNDPLSFTPAETPNLD